MQAFAHECIFFSALRARDCGASRMVARHLSGLSGAKVRDGSVASLGNRVG